MKKTLFFVMILAVLATGCKKDNKSKSLNYNDSDPIVMALSGPEYIPNVPTHYFDHKIQVSSDYDITYSAINPNNIEVIKVSSDGYIHGKNVGEARVKIDNGNEAKTVDVEVDLFIEPTFEFGCGTSRVRSLYGSPYQATYVEDTILLYRYTANHGYSYACGEMDFFFYDGEYFESDVYIKKSVDYLLGLYLEDNFVIDTALCNDTIDVYRNKLDSSIICGKFDPHNVWNEWCMFYVRLNEAKSFANVLNRRPRSSKLRY